MKPRDHSRFLGSLFCAMLVTDSLFADAEAPAVEKSDKATQMPGSAVQQARELVRQSFTYSTPRKEPPAAVTRSPQPRLAAGWDIPPEKPTPPPALARTETADPEVVKLEPFVVEERGIRWTAQQRALIDARRERTIREIGYIEDSPLDDILNPGRYSFLGPYSKTNRLGDAWARLNRLELEDRIVVLMDATTDASERAALQLYLMEVRYGKRFDR